MLPINTIWGKQIFVSPDGVDTNEGTLENPFWSVQKAQELAEPGDTVFIRGGEYIMQDSDISMVEDDLFACISFLNKSGLEGKRINYWAYRDEKPHFNFSSVKPLNQRVVAFWVSGDHLHLKGIEITGVQITITSHTESYCVYSWGNHNVFENISMHDNKGTGLRHRKGGYNLFLNCDAYRNHDDVSENKKGDNVDGFGCHPTKGGKGNIFRGCRAWLNSDDGFDCIRSFESIVFENCWAGYNGYDEDFERLGDGNGFKIGGYGYDDESRQPDTIPRNDVFFCVAFRNKANGFYANHHLGGNKWYNNTAFNNSRNFNMVNRESPESQNIDVDGYDHVLINNLGYDGRSGETKHIDASLNILTTNSFDSNIELTEEDFFSIDETQLLAERKPDGSLPDVEFMTFRPTSNLMDAGTDIGFDFLGAAPELGAFEQSLPKVVVTVLSLNHDTEHITIYPNPAEGRILVTGLVIERAWLADLFGRNLNVSVSHGSIDVGRIENGIYTLSLVTPEGEKIYRRIQINR